jgi:hypothetical protein
MQATKNYTEALKKIDFSQASETSLRTAFEIYLNELITEAKLPEYKVLQEGKRMGEFGVPDFRISFNDSMLGYIETKKAEENLDKILKSEQIKKYRELSQNLIITRLPVIISWSNLNLKLYKLTIKRTCVYTLIKHNILKPFPKTFTIFISAAIRF